MSVSPFVGQPRGLRRPLRPPCGARFSVLAGTSVPAPSSGFDAAASGTHVGASFPWRRMPPAIHIRNRVRYPTDLAAAIFFAAEI